MPKQYPGNDYNTCILTCLYPYINPYVLSVSWERLQKSTGTYRYLHPDYEFTVTAPMKKFQPLYRILAMAFLNPGKDRVQYLYPGNDFCHQKSRLDT